MCGELRELHDRIDATTVYVTHDQLEAMAMADRIAIMNQGRVEQIGTPQEIYDRPRTMFVADFIGAPSMNFLGLQRVAAARRSQHRGRRRPGRNARNPRGSARGQVCAWRAARERLVRRCFRPARPRVRRRISGYDADRHGDDEQAARSRRGCRRASRCSVGETVGLALRPDRLSLFDAVSGQALPSALYAGGQHG